MPDRRPQLIRDLDKAARDERGRAGVTYIVIEHRH
jgi:hypothetical protein